MGWIWLPIHHEGECQNDEQHGAGHLCCAMYRISPFCHSPSYTLPLERVSNGSVYEGDWQNDEIHGTAEVTCAMMFIILPLSLMMDGMDTVPMARKQCCGIRIQNEYGT